MTDLNMASMLSTGEVVFIASGLFGMVGHYVKKWAKDETKASLAEWFGKDNINASMMAFGAFGTAVIAALGSGLITPDMNVFAIVYAGLTTGWAVDSGFNKDSTPK